MNERVLGIITARGGSKRLPQKNIKPLGGSPLISWTIRAAKNSKYINRLILSTDDLHAIEISKTEGCDVPFIRPDVLSGDHSTSYDVVMHALQTLEENYDWIVLLQPTSPFRTSEDIDSAIKLALETSKNSVISVCESEKSHWMFFMRDEDGKLISPCGISIKDLNHTRSQDMPIPYEINGALYVVKTSWFKESQSFFDNETITYVMPKDRSINIDTEHDWKVAEAYLFNSKNEERKLK